MYSRADEGWKNCVVVTLYFPWFRFRRKLMEVVDVEAGHLRDQGCDSRA